MAAIYHIEDWEMAMLWGPMSIVRGQHIKKYDMILRLGGYYRYRSKYLHRRAPGLRNKLIQKQHELRIYHEKKHINNT